MKHLFYIHSSITFLVATKIVEGLDKDNCIFLWGRNFQATTDIKHHKFPFVHLPKEYFSASIKFWETRKKVVEMDDWLAQITEGQDFFYYTPQSGTNFFYVLVENVSCKGYNYIEEGRGSYFTKKQLQNPKSNSLLRDALYQINFKGRSSSVKHFFDFDHPKFKTAYGLSQHTFPDLQDKVILDIPFQKKEFPGNYEHILVPEPIVEFGIVSEATYQQTVVYFLEWAIQKKYTTIHVKYHPGQKKSIELMRAVYQQYKDQLTVIELPAEWSLEEMAVSTTANFVIITSSVGIYASLANRTVYSLAQQLVQLDATYQKAIDDLPDFFKKELIFI